MEATYFSVTSVDFYPTAWPYISEDRAFHNCCDSLIGQWHSTWGNHTPGSRRKLFGGKRKHLWDE
jgi:hypothetical protein